MGNRPRAGAYVCRGKCPGMASGSPGGMGGSVGESVETPTLVIRLLGAPSVNRAGVEVTLPRSRKVRALLAYLALSPQPVSRSRLCDVLWDVPNDPRGELRWCLSKLRGLLDEDEHARVVTSDDQVGLDLSDAHVDVVDIERAAKTGFDKIPPAELGRLCDRFTGDVLDGVEI